MGYDMDIDKEYVCTCSLEQKSLQEKIIERIMNGSLYLCFNILYF